jgi:hypothetical protein
MLGFDVGDWVGVVVVAVGVVGVVVGDVVEVGVAVVVRDVVGVGVQVGEDDAVLLAVAVGCVPRVADWDVVGFFAGVLVAVGVPGGRVVSPARDAAGLTPPLDAPPECDVSTTATTATMTTAAAAVISQRHRRSGDRRLPGGMPPVPPGMSRPAVKGPDAGTKDVSGRRLRSSLVAEADSAAADGGMDGARTVGSYPTGPGPANAAGTDAAGARAGSACGSSASRRAGGSGVWSVGL